MVIGHGVFQNSIVKHKAHHNDWSFEMWGLRSACCISKNPAALTYTMSVLGQHKQGVDCTM